MTNAVKLKTIKSSITRLINSDFDWNVDRDKANKTIDLLASLSRIKTAKSASVALHALNIKDGAITEYVAEVLDKIGRKYSEAFIESIKNTDNYPRFLHTLSAVNDKEYVADIINDLVDDEVCGDSCNLNYLNAIADVMIDSPHINNSYSMQQMLLLDDESLSLTVLETLDKFGKAALSILVIGLESSSYKVREATFNVLANYNDIDVIEAIFGNIYPHRGSDQNKYIIEYYLKYDDQAVHYLHNKLDSADEDDKLKALYILNLANLIEFKKYEPIILPKQTLSANHIKLYRNCLMDTAYYDETYAETGDECEVKFDGNHIVVSYPSEEGPVVFRGVAKSEGHYELFDNKDNCRATLHMFAGSKYLEGYWSYPEEKGFWRITLGTLHSCVE